MFPKPENRTVAIALFGVGIVLGSLFGLIFALLRKGSVGQPINIWNSFGSGANMPALSAGVPVPPAPNSEPDTRAISTGSVLNSIALRTDSPFKLFTAPEGTTWNVRINTVGPPGAVAFVSTAPSGFSGTVPSPNATPIPTGQWIDVRLQSRQSVSAIGSINGTIVGVAASEVR